MQAAAVGVDHEDRPESLERRVAPQEPNLTAAGVSLTSVSVSCTSLTGGTDALEAYAAGASSLQNLGDGYYQWNWASDKGWAGTCRRIQIGLGDQAPDGGLIVHSADFQFTR